MGDMLDVTPSQLQSPLGVLQFLGSEIPMKLYLLRLHPGEGGYLEDHFII